MKRKSRTKEQGRNINEVQRQTTERTHIVITDTWSDYTFKCDCGRYGEGEQSTSGKFWESCQCGYENSNL